MKSQQYILVPLCCSALSTQNHQSLRNHMFLLRMNNDGDNSQNKEGPFRELLDIFSNFDDVIDDFFYKRMGQGEIFYGKRKFRPSGKVEGDYNGFGLSDKTKIDVTRAYKEEWLEEKKMRDEIRMIMEERENRK